MKKIFIPILFLTISTLAFAQDEDVSATTSGSGDDYSYAAGDFSGAIKFGNTMFLSDYGNLVPGAAGTNTNWTVSGTAPTANMINLNTNSIFNMIGGEARYFITSNMAVRLSGGGIVRNTPGRDNLPGYIDPDAPNSSWIPNYSATEARSDFAFTLIPGYEYHFNSKYSRLKPYVAAEVPFFYGRHSRFDPTTYYNNIDAVNTGTSLNILDVNVIRDVGVRHIETAGFGVQIVGGVDYYIMEGFFMGFEIRPISYIYLFNMKYPGPGIEGKGADSHTLSFLAQPNFKLGFRF